MEFENLLTLIKAVSDSELTEFHYEENGTNIHFVKEQPQQIPVQVQTVAAAAPQAAAAETGNAGSETAAEPEGMVVKAPLVGTFYAAPSEDADPFCISWRYSEKGTDSCHCGSYEAYERDRKRLQRKDR